MKHLELHGEPEGIRNFVLALKDCSEMVILELDGNPVIQVNPVSAASPRYDVARLEKAVLARRDLSREVNSEWEPLDLECWDRV
jgi:hypothetical protein